MNILRPTTSSKFLRESREEPDLEREEAEWLGSGYAPMI